MILKKVFITLILAGLMVTYGCGSNPATPGDNSDIEAFFAGVSPQLTGVVGDYSYTGDDGTMESGKLIADDNGNISMVADRGASIFSNYWFNIDIDYKNPRYYTGMGLPVYYIGDTFDYDINIEYKRGLPLDNYPILYASLISEQRYYPSMTLLPGNAVEEWNPLAISPYESLTVTDDFKIESGTRAGNDVTVCKIDLHFMSGLFQFNLANGVCGFWDP